MYKKNLMSLPCSTRQSVNTYIKGKKIFGSSPKMTVFEKREQNKCTVTNKQLLIKCPQFCYAKLKAKANFVNGYQCTAIRYK